MHDLKKARLFLLDMDGTIYIDNDLFDGVTDFLDYIDRIGGKYIFITNNSSKTSAQRIEKLASLGISTTPDNFLSSADATVLYLKNKSYRKIYVLGTASFCDQLRAAGLPVTNTLEDDIDCLCMGFDTEITFQKLEDACILLREDIDYIATNPDLVCPTRYGYVPDCGSISDILYNATKKRPVFIGKPQPEMALLAMEKTGFSPAQTALIGDRIYTDIACGVNAGVSSILVLSGEATMQDVGNSEIKPHFIYRDIKQLYEELCR